MRTPLSAENPFGLDAKGHLWEVLKRLGASERHLDFGAHDGQMLRRLAQTNAIGSGVGLDANSKVVARAKPSLPSNVDLQLIKKGAPLPFPDHHFTSSSIVGVLEHIHDQSRILNELHRVTAEGGIFMIAVPGSHLFSFLDMGNWKFVFPRLHRLFYSRTFGRDAYVARYTANADGLIGDIEAEKAWHEHFSKPKLCSLLDAHGFDVLEVDGFGFFNRFLMNARYFLPGGTKKLLDPVITLDKKLFSSAEIWAIARKRAKGPRA
jgi:SAM-dependent methyltransferase